MRVIDLRRVLRAQQPGAKGISSMLKARLIEAILDVGGEGTPAVAPRVPPPLIGPTQLQRPRLVRPIYDRRPNRPNYNAPRGTKQRVSSPMPGTPMGSPMPGTPDERTRRPRLIKPDRSVRSARGINTPPPTAPRPRAKTKKAVPRPRLITPSMLKVGVFSTPPTAPRPKSLTEAQKKKRAAATKARRAARKMATIRAAKIRKIRNQEGMAAEDNPRAKKKRRGIARKRRDQLGMADEDRR